MSYYASEEEITKNLFRIHGNGKHCVLCSEPLKGPTIVYDVSLHPGSREGIAMHRDCAFAMSQRIICDAWPNRHHDGLMKNNK